MYVGGDAHIAPLGIIEFAGDFRKTGPHCRVDVGIAPYAPLGRFPEIRNVFPWKTRNFLGKLS